MGISGSDGNVDENKILDTIIDDFFVHYQSLGFSRVEVHSAVQKVLKVVEVHENILSWFQADNYHMVIDHIMENPSSPSRSDSSPLRMRRTIKKSEADCTKIPDETRLRVQIKEKTKVQTLKNQSSYKGSEIMQRHERKSSFQNKVNKPLSGSVEATPLKMSQTTKLVDRQENPSVNRKRARIEENTSKVNHHLPNKRLEKCNKLSVGKDNSRSKVMLKELEVNEGLSCVRENSDSSLQIKNKMVKACTNSAKSSSQTPGITSKSNRGASLSKSLDKPQRPPTLKASHSDLSNKHEISSGKSVNERKFKNHCSGTFSSEQNGRINGLSKFQYSYKESQSMAIKNDARKYPNNFAQPQRSISNEKFHEKKGCHNGGIEAESTRPRTSKNFVDLNELVAESENKSAKVSENLLAGPVNEGFSNNSTLPASVESPVRPSGFKISSVQEDITTHQNSNGTANHRQREITTKTKSKNKGKEETEEAEDVFTVILSYDISNGRENKKIPCVNDCNDSALPENFNYISQNVIFSGAEVKQTLERIADMRCSCSGNCLTSAMSCRCTDDTRGTHAYDNDGRLISDLARNYGFDDERNRIFITECNIACSCNKTCGNRVVQNGLNFKLQVFMTKEGKGWGVRARERIPARSFLFEYKGEILTNTEQYARNMEYKEKRLKKSFQMLLDADYDMENNHFRNGLDDNSLLTLDATQYGNVARFVNHRCGDPNLLIRPVLIETRDTHYYHVAFFASRDIEKWEELTWDYSIDFTQDHEVEGFECLCGSRYCRDKRSRQSSSKHKVKI